MFTATPNSANQAANSAPSSPFAHMIQQDPSPRQAQIIVVEGNIGVGKSTLTARIAKSLGGELFSEPVSGNPFLTRFYQNPNKWAFPMQLWLLRQRFRTYVSALIFMLRTGRSVILDRSIFSDIVFAQNSFESGQISPAGYAYYLTLREKLLAFLPPPSIVLYLHASPEVCYHRIIQVRRRACEAGMPLEYLQGLQNCFQRWQNDMTARGVPVLCLPWEHFGSHEAVARQVQVFGGMNLDMPPQYRAQLIELLTDTSLLSSVLDISFNCPDDRVAILRQGRALHCADESLVKEINQLEDDKSLVYSDEGIDDGRVDTDTLQRLCQGFTA